ncbi:hypothetical protein BJY21_000820 [Kineosphaera limosa]|uniref:VOC domain-containing protein n=1 Tax=Kineosphaera limosa NBRC 100340 TaxID=1184609 RepID=K6XGD1_9MICO|nr:VOC family protein [Kineosphaera limosa]NYD99635.1 hypothetical protein [Kineosphaera limosa]GAB97874.1 hypothetical protein KILIM_085_00190 [Kineosphaera limosa NBRC 100340]
MLALRAVVFDTTDPSALAQFWSQVTSSPIAYDWGEFVLVNWEPRLAFQYVSHPTPGKNRIHIDLRSSDERTAEVEIERIVELGATRIGSVEMRGASWVVLADPDGNEFCLFRTVPEQVERALLN